MPHDSVLTLPPRQIDVPFELALGAPSEEPLTVEALRAHLRVDTPHEDELLRGYLRAARAWCEHEADVSLGQRTCTLRLDAFPRVIELRIAPLTAITSIAYLDGAGASQTLAASLYRADLTSRPGRITPAYGQVWPTTYPVTNAVTVTFTAGWAPASVPPEALQAIRLLVALEFEEREPTEAQLMRVKRILDPVRWH